MDRTEAATVLDELLAGFPFTDLDVAARQSWVESIEDTAAGYPKSREIAHRWARTHERFPTLVEFLTTITPRVYVQPVDDPDEARVPPAVARQMGRLWRQALADVDARIAANPLPRGVAGHWHGGPDPCPLCGGKPPL